MPAGLRDYSTFYCPDTFPSSAIRFDIAENYEIASTDLSCDTWLLTLREEHRHWVFENRILRRSYGPKRDGNGKWRRLHNEKLYGSFL
jgi:hypothetical protein